MASEISFSGIRAHLARLDTTAHNMANASTEGFAPYRAQLQEGADGRGVEVSAVTQPTPAASPEATSSVDLATELVNMIAAQRGVESNVRMIEADDEVHEALLNRRR